MQRDLMIIDVALLWMARFCVAGTAGQRKQRRDAVQIVLDQVAETVASAGVTLVPGGFSVDPNGHPGALVSVDMDPLSVAVMADMVEQAVWPEDTPAELDDAVINLVDTFHGWVADAEAEERFNQLPPEARERILAQQAGEGA